MASTNKQGKMAGYINYRMRVTLNDGRQMTGQMLAFDKHMNLVLADTEEFRKLKSKQNKPTAPGAAPVTQTIVQEEKRTLGLTIIRGSHIVSLSVESPPPADPSTRLGKSSGPSVASALAAGPGVARPAAGRGAAPAIALAGPAAGVGGAPPPQFPGFGGQSGGPPVPPPGFPGRGGPPPGFPGTAPPPGFPGAPPNFPGAPAGFPGGPVPPFPGGPPPGFPGGGAPFPPPGFPQGGPPGGFPPAPRR